jgi:ketopantoate reductase
MNASREMHPPKVHVVSSKAITTEKAIDLYKRYLKEDILNGMKRAYS